MAPQDVIIPDYFPDIPEVRMDITESILILKQWTKKLTIVKPIRRGWLIRNYNNYVLE